MVGSALSIESSIVMKLSGMRLSLNSCLVWGWNLKKSVLSGLIFRKLKKPSEMSAELNGGAPNASIKNRTPNEKISVVEALQGILLAP